MGVRRVLHQLATKVLVTVYSWLCYKPLGLTWIPYAGYLRARTSLETPLSKVPVTVKSIETANRMLQERGAPHSSKMSTWVAVKPATPTPTAIAKAGERALQASKK
jgi:hypothetical protein